MTTPPLARSLFLLALLSLAAACGGTASEAESSTSSGGEAATGSFLPAQGEHAIGVYFQVVGADDADGGRGLVAELGARGGLAGVGQLSCDQGAAESLGRSPDDVVVSAAFRTREDADRFVAAWGRPILGIAEFTAYCRD
ncbi:MAG: hypothetical protein U0230_10535 [Polyangiales bacterium]